MKESKVEKLFSLAAGLTLVAVERPALHKDNQPPGWAAAVYHPAVSRS